MKSEFVRPAGARRDTVKCVLPGSSVAVETCVASSSPTSTTSPRAVSSTAVAFGRGSSPFALPSGTSCCAAPNPPAPRARANASIGCSSAPSGPSSATVAPSEGSAIASNPGQSPQLPCRGARLTAGPNAPRTGRSVRYVPTTSWQDENTVDPIAASPEGPKASTGSTPGSTARDAVHPAIAGEAPTAPAHVTATSVVSR